MKILAARMIVCSPDRNFVTLRIDTDKGCYGLGDAMLHGRELAVAAYLTEYVVPCLIGRDPACIEDVWQYLYRGAYPTGRPSSTPLARTAPLTYVTDIANYDARTEGMSYGMMVAVQTNHKAEFDALWNWANTYMRINDPKTSVGYFAWSMNVDGTSRSEPGAA